MKLRKITYFVNLLFAFSFLIIASCGKKEPDRSQNYTPKGVAVSYNKGTPIIEWQTDQPSFGSVLYGTSPGSYNHFSYEAEKLTTNHSLQVIDADSGITYYFVARSITDDGIIEISSEGEFRPQAHPPNNLFEWTMLDISQGYTIGDCHYIQTPNGYRLFIDSGYEEKINTIYSFCNSLGVNHFNLALLTHFHADHYGGFLGGLFDNYDFDSLKIPITHESEYDWAYSDVINSAQNNNIGISYVNEGDTLNWDPSLSVIALHAGSMNDGNENNSSIVLKITYGDIDFILTGDAEIPSETMILDDFPSYQLDCEVLKVGHHGKSDATSDEWLDVITPKAALIPVDQQSSWGGNSLPSQSEIDKLKGRNIDIFRSDKNNPNDDQYHHGNITVFSDGVSYEIVFN